MGQDLWTTAWSDPPPLLPSLSLLLSPLFSKQLQRWPSPIWLDMVACDPAWLRRRPDQRQRSSLGKTFGLRTDGISVRKPFPLGSLVLRRGDRVTTQKRQHERGGDANPHTWGSLSVLHSHFTTTTNYVSLLLLCCSLSKLSATQYICAPSPNYTNLTRPCPPSFYAPPSHPPPQPFTPKTLKLHHRGLTGNPDTNHC